MMTTTIILMLIMVISGLVFGLQNFSVVEVDFLFWSFKSSIGLLVAVSFFMGLILPSAFLLPSILAKKYIIKKLRKEKDNLQKRLDDSGILFEAPGLGIEGEKYKNK